jgi:fimbrial isopeptide formation D2 family protein/LPXTG-motif cell wall-anchored protein
MTALAEDGNATTQTAKTITLTGGKAGHTYTLYQIFIGKVEDGELTNIQWGTGANSSYQAAYPTAAAAALQIAEQNDARATAQTLVENNYLETGTTNTLSADGEVVFEGLAEGYYMIVDTNGNENPTAGDYTSAYIVKVVEDVTGEIKGSATTSDKEIIDPENSQAASNDAAAYSIGDSVPFKLKATTADNVAAYKKYHVTFQDKQSEGLTAPTSFAVTVLGKDFTVPFTGNDPASQTTDAGTKITVTKVTPDTGNTFAIKVEFEPASEESPYLNTECNSTDIVVTYSSVLNSNAAIGVSGNTNEMHVTYSNNPEDADGGEEGKTPDDTVKVFTYKPVIDKIDGAGNPLNGAGFTIYQQVTQGTENAIKGSDLSFADGVEHDKIDENKYYIKKAMTTVSGNNAQFEFKGLADGTYVLVETQIPTGFNAFNSVEFTISSTVSEEGGITTLTGGAPFNITNPGADGAMTSGNHSLDSGELYAEIENNSGQELPSTGGIGTTIFYIVGGVMVAGAVVFLLTKRRIAGNE